jgi:hypothetical protein
MILSLLLASLSIQSPVRRVELSRGGLVPFPSSPAHSYRYWDVEDTTLDGTDPDASRGGEATLIGGPASVILVRFGDLSRALGRYPHIRKASLHFTIASGDKPTLTGVSRLLQSWGEGPYQTTNGMLSILSQSAPDAKPTKPAIPKMAATWKTREAGFDNGTWQIAGARGPQDSIPLPEVTMVSTDKEVEIQGLASAFQWFADHPSRNDGLSLRFATQIEFFSGQSSMSRPRLELELDEQAPTQRKGADLSVVSISHQDGGGFAARIKNVGDAPATGFTSTWTMNGRTGSSVERNDKLAPGEESTLTTTEEPRFTPDDHRSSTVSLDISPKGPDASSANDSLTIYPQARGIDFLITPEVASHITGIAPEDWIQEQVAIFNDTYLGQSHFSFAPDGAKERVMVQSVHLDIADPASLKGEAKVTISAEMVGDGKPSARLAKAIGEAIGLIDLSSMNVPARTGRILVSGAQDRGTQDLYAGVMGGGDTRFDGLFSGALMLPYDLPFGTQEDGPVTEWTGLLTMTDIYMLNTAVGKSIPRGLPSIAPKAVLLCGFDLLGRPLTGASLSFYQSSGSKLLDAPPVFKLSLNDHGNAVIPSRDGQGIFGKLDPEGSNGLLLVKAESNGVSEWGWIKAWQIIDAAARGIASAAILNVTFDLPGSRIDSDVNFASQKFVSDSTGQSPDKLATLVDGDGKQTVSLGSKVGDWVEIDLGRDRTLAEIKIAAAADHMWPSFDIVLYGTGQLPQDGTVFARERNWKNSRQNRSDGAEDSATVSYRGLPIQVRYIRLVSRSEGRCDIAKICVTPAKLSN